jgi:hypothetical protein
VLALARRSGPLPEDPGEQPPLSLEPVGLVVLAEELRLNVMDTIAFLDGEGVEVKVLSGDAPQTVASIACAESIATYWWLVRAATPPTVTCGSANVHASCSGTRPVRSRSRRGARTVSWSRGWLVLGSDTKRARVRSGAFPRALDRPCRRGRTARTRRRRRPGRAAACAGLASFPTYDLEGSPEPKSRRSVSGLSPPPGGRNGSHRRHAWTPS